MILDKKESLKLLKEIIKNNNKKLTKKEIELIRNLKELKESVKK
jgi:hypothetical protein